MKPRILFLITLLCAAVASVQIVHAATFTVSNTGDNGGVNPAPNADTGTLRQAIVDANPTAGADTITFTVTGTILLASALPNLSDDVTISGPGANMLAVDGNHASRVFSADSGKTVTISGLTITHGSASPGGGISNSGTLTVTNSTLSGNSAVTSGGGIYNGNGTLTVTNSTLSGNSASLGGGIVSEGAQVGGSATLTITNSTISGNSATDGGGIYNAANQGGIATVIIGDTVLNVGASGSGANISNDSQAPGVGTITSHGYNLSSDDAHTLLNQPSDQNGTDPLLDPNGLQPNGGPTLTIALQPNSPAINAGDPNFTPPPVYDQRGSGFDRVVNGRIDKGAFEVQTIVCPQPQGYWKNNPDAWPVSALPMTLGSQTYTTQTELLTILRTPIGKGTKADASLILADQLIAAKLNIANGADGTPVTSTIADAEAVLSLYTGKLPYRVRPNSTNGRRMVNDAAILESYNKGLLTPGCGG